MPLCIAMQEWLAEAKAEGASEERANTEHEWLRADSECLRADSAEAEIPLLRARLAKYEPV